MFTCLALEHPDSCRSMKVFAVLNMHQLTRHRKGRADGRMPRGAPRCPGGLYLPRVKPHPCELVFVARKMHKTRTGNGGELPRRFVVCLALKLQRADKVAYRTQLKPARHHGQQSVGV